MKAKKIFLFVLSIVVIVVSVILINFYFKNDKSLSNESEIETVDTLESMSTLITSNELDGTGEIEIIGGFPDESTEKYKSEIVSRYKIVGYFVNTEWGDYRHLKIKDLEENTQDFFISMGINMEVLTSIEENPELAKKKIEVIWYKVKKFIPEAGSFCEIDVAMKINILD